MIVDRLVLHHTYAGQTAFDVSQHHHHGELEGVAESGGGALRLTGGDDCVRIPATRELRSLRAVRTRVEFLWHPTGGARRHNLIEGYLSFALVIEDDGALGGGILDRTGNWRGARSSAGLVTPGHRHTATLVHDGLSSCRLDFNGTTVAEAFDVPGPAQGVQNPYGLTIGHWPDPDDRYSFEGDIHDVKVWVDRLDDGSELGDPCCCHGSEEADRAFDRLRDENPDLAEYRDAAEKLYDLGSRIFGQMAAGDKADRDHAHHLARRFALGLQMQDRQSLGTTISDAAHLAQSRITSTDLDTAAAELKSAFDQTLLGPVLDQAMAGGEGATPENIEKTLKKLGLDAWLRGFCLGWATPPKAPGEGQEKPEHHPDHSTDPMTDHGPSEPGPSWGMGAEHDDGDDSGGDPK
ncbi:MAG: hypothetical protein JHC95_09925 [Solirubrobacteraceae bacterium]|nr:hypothetical protein [Solirubrobacteraceae bacterium]